MTGERIARHIARAGLCSRRTAEAWITAGRVQINGERIAAPNRNVGPGDTVIVDGSPLPIPAAARLFRFHKPPGVLTTHADPAGRPTIFDLLPGDLPFLHAVGRLDIDSEGLLLLTTGGAVKRVLELPRTGLARRYRVRVFGPLQTERLEDLINGVEIDGVRYGSVAVSVRQSGRSNAWLDVTVHEGKNREVRRVLQYVGLQVNRLIRTAYGPIRLGSLPRGALEEVPPTTLRSQFDIRSWDG